MFLSGYQKQCAFIAVLALLIAPIVGFSHAAIPHAHTHASDNALHAAIEHGLDSSLSRKDIALPGVFAFFVLYRIRKQARARVSTRVIHQTPLLQELRRGVLHYRRFR